MNPIKEEALLYLIAGFLLMTYYSEGIPTMSTWERWAGFGLTMAFAYTGLEMVWRRRK